MRVLDEPTVNIENRTLDYIGAIEGLKRPKQVAARFQNFVEGLGFSNAACIKLPDSCERLDDTILMNTRCRGWTKAYLKEDLLARDPMVLEMRNTYLPFAWEDVLDRGALQGPQAEVMDCAAQYGMRSGFVVPITETSGYTGLVSIAGDRERLDDGSRNALMMAAFYTHTKLNGLRQAEVMDQYSLTQRELECLKWVAAGKSDWQVGQILSVSPKTVNFHIENVKRKFGVATRIQAVVAGMRHGFKLQ